MSKLMLILGLNLLYSQVSISSALFNNENSTNCEDFEDCGVENRNCANECGCDSAVALVMTYNETLGHCVVNYKQLLQSLGQKYNTQEKIREEVEKVFEGIMISVILFITCAGVGFVAACVYCCKICYMDNKLKQDVDALQKKLKRDGILRKTIKPKSKTGSGPESESCNIIVEDAGVFVV
ncbi:uncharacterized protein LOC121726547 [Aricia agestis]|uniref:uncharacterized protein LOC121726547 n=1 Tax=Aricia agestis TaxID=91739 RepID=UPI001C208E41|nr:uncharacterized protein LOC121726547 [Aricia agestis]